MNQLKNMIQLGALMEGISEVVDTAVKNAFAEEKAKQQNWGDWQAKRSAGSGKSSSNSTLNLSFGFQFD